MGCCFTCCKVTKKSINVSTPNLTKILRSQEFKNAKFPFKNIVIEGASSNGTVTIGAYKILEQTGILKQLKKFAGSSSGSIFAAFASIGMKYDEIKNAFMGLDMNRFKDDSFGIFRDTARLLNRYGFYKGDVMENWVEDTLHNTTEIKNITFQQIYEKYGTELYITRVNLSKLRVEYISKESHPNMVVSRAVRQSASIPFIFKSVEENGDIIIDGAIGDPYPIDLFDNPDDKKINQETFGLKIMSSSEKKDFLIKDDYKIGNIVDFASALATFTMVCAERNKVKKGHWERTITLRSPERSVGDFCVSETEKIRDIISGEQDTIRALVNYINNKSFV
jgi:NTE family protein